MKGRVGLTRICVLGAALYGAGWSATGALAQTMTTIANPATDAATAKARQTDAKAKPKKTAKDSMAKADPVPFWWFHGTIEVGGRFFINDPQKTGAAYKGQKSLASYYEYTDVAPGAFSNIDIATGSKDGLYEVDLGGHNIGYNDQSYYLDYSKAGEQYFSFEWDQTPHIYGYGQTFYNGVGSTSLTLPPGYVPSAGNPGLPNAINPFLYTTELGIRRDTASAQYRWTPDDAWDVRVDYSNMHRQGTQVDGVIMGGFGAGGPYTVTVPRPVDDTTQNYGVNGEYAGTSPWGKRLTIKLAYNGSNYDDDFSSYTIQNPFSGLGTTSQPARLSTWPSNRADAFSATMGADLPWDSRYVGHLSYDMMRQNESFIPMTTGANFILPASSLNGAINTILSDNILTTKISPELTSKVSYRFYDFQNNTPEIFFANWTSYDQASSVGTEGPINSLSMAYIKQDAGYALNWRPSRAWNLGAAYGFERYDWTRADANATNENSGKVFADWTPNSWFTLRSSSYYANRRFDNYNYYGYVCDFNFATNCFTANEGYSTAYRQFFLDNRQRWRANLATDIVVLPGLTLTPTFQYLDDSYNLSQTEEGINTSSSWNAGADLTYLINPVTSVMVGYLREYGKQVVYNCTCGGHSNNNAIPTPATFLETDDRATVDSFTALVRYAAIPDHLNLSLRYTLSHALDRQQLQGAAPYVYPNDTTWFQHLDAVAVYTFDKDQVEKLGWKGTVKAKLHYSWERNSVNNWQNDSVAVYNAAFTSGTDAIFMAYDNPNYNVHMIMASLAFGW
jgi:MtrB/PioB family decaheme-associated outer membrane protein